MKELKVGRTSSRGFTLIELLVVIAIIAILAAILFPVFAKAREKARQISCASNEKQLGLGFLQYQEDYDEHNPHGSGGLGFSAVGWAGEIYSYVKSTGVYKCPDDVSYAVVSYGYNSDNTSVVSGVETGLTLSQYTAPASTVLLFEMTGNGSSTSTGPAYDITGSSGTPESGSPSGVGLGADGSYYNGYGSSLQYATGLMLNSVASSGGFQSTTGRHTDGSNYLMDDGHVKWLRGSSVSDGNAYSAQPTFCGGGNYWASNIGCSSVPYTVTFSPY